MRSLRLVIGLGTCAMLLSSCTLIPTASSPDQLSRKEIPFGLLSPSVPGTNGGHVQFITQPVYIVDVTGQLAPSSRIVPSPPALATVLRQLILGPTQIESAAGYRSALPKNLVLLSANIKRGVGYIDLATSLASLSRSNELLAIGQLVLTAYDVGATRGVEITVGDVVQQSPLPNGTRATLVTTNDYQRLMNG